MRSKLIDSGSSRARVRSVLTDICGRDSPTKPHHRRTPRATPHRRRRTRPHHRRTLHRPHRQTRRRDHRHRHRPRTRVPVCRRPVPPPRHRNPTPPGSRHTRPLRPVRALHPRHATPRRRRPDLPMGTQHPRHATRPGRHSGSRPHRHRQTTHRPRPTQPIPAHPRLQPRRSPLAPTHLRTPHPSRLPTCCELM